MLPYEEMHLRVSDAKVAQNGSGVVVAVYSEFAGNLHAWDTPGIPDVPADPTSSTVTLSFQSDGGDAVRPAIFDRVRLSIPVRPAHDVNLNTADGGQRRRSRSLLAADGCGTTGTQCLVTCASFDPETRVRSTDLECFYQGDDWGPALTPSRPCALFEVNATHAQCDVDAGSSESDWTVMFTVPTLTYCHVPHPGMFDPMGPHIQLCRRLARKTSSLHGTLWSSRTSPT